MLKQTQAWEYNRFKTLGMFLGENSAVYSSFAPFAAEAEDFGANFQALEALIPQKTENATGVTTNKTEIKQELSTALALICRKTRAYALRFDQPELAAQTNTYEAKIFRMRESDILGYTTSIVNLLTPLLTNTDYMAYGVTSDSLEQVAGLAASFNSLIGVAKQTDSGNTVANTAIDAAIVKLRHNIAQMDLLVDEFQADNPGFVQGYHINSAIDNVGVHHSGIEGIVRNSSGQPIAHAVVHLDGTTKTATTDLLGAYRLDRVTPDDYMVMVSATGYTPQQLVHHISRGKIDELDFQLAS